MYAQHCLVMGLIKKIAMETTITHKHHIHTVITCNKIANREPSTWAVTPESSSSSKFWKLTSIWVNSCYLDWGYVRVSGTCKIRPLTLFPVPYCAVMKSGLSGLGIASFRGILTTWRSLVVFHFANSHQQDSVSLVLPWKGWGWEIEEAVEVEEEGEEELGCLNH